MRCTYNPAIVEHGRWKVGEKVRSFLGEQSGGEIRDGSIATIVGFVEPNLDADAEWLVALRFPDDPELQGSVEGFEPDRKAWYADFSTIKKRTSDNMLGNFPKLKRRR